MIGSTLDYDKAPPLWLPTGFFLAAIGWLLVLALSLAAASPLAADRYQPLVVALTHMLALGVLGNIMLGALLQLLAVLAGVALTRPIRLLWTVWLPWQAGVALLCLGFARGFSPDELLAGVIGLALALAVFLTHGIVGLHRSPARDGGSRGMLRAMTALMVTALLGLAMVATLRGSAALPLLPLLHSHVLWGGIGWLLGLLIAISQTVLPMFLITPAYPRPVRWLSAALLPLLLLATLWRLLAPAMPDPSALALWLAVMLYGALTLRLLQQARRPQDPARRSWQRAVWCLPASALLALVAWWSPAACWPLLAGWLWLGGLGFGVMLAMLGKIVPFLCWLHLKALQPPRGALPSTHGFLSEQVQQRLGWLHALWLAGGIGWCLSPALWQGVFAASSTLLAGSLAWLAWRITRQYRALRRQFLADAPHPASHY
ncbi:hypothetical protein THUN1379_28920 [Paludibacterium sp. THUN1379]|uniref:hypothetical protein n=1 Tax=Paludibacterium sp. THUN1379 TaxID=3112107 RepID=UPI00308E96AA|nr:hypothetical protein THUN1379_28920 [Paludibacterium sp. THUN1379]